MYIRNGAYGTIIRRPEGDWWVAAIEYTLADYLSMRPGDLIFFFRARRIFGVGQLVSFPVAGRDVVALCNYPGSLFPHARPPDDERMFLWRENGEENIRWVVFFKPHPHFFRDGLDMDEVLQSDVKGVVRALPTFERVSFIKVESEEAKVILDLLMRRNEEVLNGEIPREQGVFPDETEDVHASVLQRGLDLEEYLIDIDGLVTRYADERARSVRHEALVQAWLANAITNNFPSTTSIFGRWDFAANQVPASPHKPTRWMDRMDMFGLVERSLAEDIGPTITRYKIVEVKRDTVGSIETIDQVMKYVAWVAHTRAGGDYGPVDAYIVAHGYSDEVIDYVNRRAAKDYILPRRPYHPQRWDRLTLVRYQYIGGTPALRLEIVREPPALA